MRKIFTPFLIFIFSFYYSQLTTTLINFNTYNSPIDNDLKNNFLPTTYYNLSQNGSNYYVTVPLQGTPTQPITYCSKYQGIGNEVMSISLDYKLELYPSFGGPSNAVGISLTDNNNSLVLSTRIYNQQVIIDGLTNPSTTFSPTLTGNGYSDDNWYRLSLEISKVATNKFSLTIKVFNLGQNGQSVPSQVLSHTVQGFNYSFLPTNLLNVNLFGGWWGDVRYIDNFSIYGFKNGSNCQSLSVNENKNLNHDNIYPNPFSDYIYVQDSYKKIEIYELSGKLLKSFEKPNEKVDLSTLEKGIYLIKMYKVNDILTEKIIKK